LRSAAESRLAKEHGQLWINHDKAQRDSLNLAPRYYE